MSTEDMALLCFSIIVSLLIVALIFCLIIECYKEANLKKIKLLSEENEKLRNSCAILTLASINFFTENENLKKIKKSKRK